MGIETNEVETSDIKTIIALLLRHGLTVYGGAAMFNPNEVQALSGAAAVLIGILWSVWQKRSKNVA